MLISERASIRYGAIFDVPGREARISELEALSAEPGFWDDQQKAQKLNKERVGLEKILDEFKQHEKAVEDAEVLLELGLEAGDESVESELKGAARYRFGGPRQA